MHCVWDADTHCIKTVHRVSRIALQTIDSYNLIDLALYWKDNSLFMESDQFWNLLARKLAREASLRELYELDKMLYFNPELQCWMRLMTDLWNSREEIIKEPGGNERFLQLLETAYKRRHLYHGKTPKKRSSA